MQNVCFNSHDMIGHDHEMKLCHEVIQPIRSHDHDMSVVNSISKEDWFYLVNTLSSWRVFNPRSVVKRNPQIAWRVMNLCKDPNVRVKGAYFTTCFKRECFKAELKSRLNKD